MKRISSDPPRIEESDLLRDWKQNLTNAVNVLERPVFSFASAVGVGNASGVETELYKTTIPRSFLSQPGEALKVLFGGQMTNNLNEDKKLLIKLGGQTLVDMGDADYTDEEMLFSGLITISYYSATTLVFSSKVCITNVVLGGYVLTGAITLDPLNVNNDLIITGDGTDEDDVILNLCLGTFLGMPIKPPNITQAVIVV